MGLDSGVPFFIEIAPDDHVDLSPTEELGSEDALMTGNESPIGANFDGLPLTGAGGTPYELFEPLGLEYTEVLRGGNAFDYGSVALGGAINYVTKSGSRTLHLPY